MIQLKNLKITLNSGTPAERTIIDQLNLDIKEGEFITLIGGNGAGKSTLLNAIAGETLPSQGSITIHGEDVTRLPTFRRSHLVARVFQDPLVGTCGDLTIAENLALAYARGKSRTWVPAINQRLRTIFSDRLATLKLGLENRLDSKMNELSGGQRQAISLFMASMSPLKVLLLDEHTSALDPKTAHSILSLTQKLIADTKVTAIMVTHQMDQALATGSRTLFLNQGKIAADLSGVERSRLTASDLLLRFGN